MNVSDVMSKKVVTLAPKATFRELWRTFFRIKVNAIPVVDVKKKILGIITRENLLEKLYPDYQDLFSLEDDFPDFDEMEQSVKDLSSKTASDFMHRHVVFAHEDTPVMRALSRMIVRRINQLPVVNDTGRLVGMVTKGDIFYSLFRKNMRRR